MKFKSMTDAKLHKLVDQAQSELALRKSKAQAVVEIQKHIKLSGFTLDDLIGGRTKSVKGFKVAPKWRHKEDKSLTWSGRGRQPKWIKKFGVKL